MTEVRAAQVWRSPTGQEFLVERVTEEGRVDMFSVETGNFAGWVHPAALLASWTFVRDAPNWLALRRFTPTLLTDLARVLRVPRKHVARRDTTDTVEVLVPISRVDAARAYLDGRDLRCVKVTAWCVRHHGDGCQPARAKQEGGVGLPASIDVAIACAAYHAPKGQPGSL